MNKKYHWLFILFLSFGTAGCMMSNHQDFVLELEKQEPSLKFYSLYENSCRFWLKKYFTDEIAESFHLGDIRVHLKKDLGGCSGFYYPYLDFIDVDIGEEVYFLDYKRVFFHEVFHRIWFEYMSSEEKDKFCVEFLALPEIVILNVDLHIEQSYCFLTRPFAIWTERFAILGQVVLSNGLFIEGYQSHPLFSSDFFNIYKPFVKGRYLINDLPQYNLYFSFMLSTSDGHFFSIKRIPRDIFDFWSGQGGVIWSDDDGNSYLHFDVKPVSDKWFVYDKTGKCVIYNKSEVKVDISLSIESLWPAEEYILFNGRSIPWVENFCVKISEKDLDFIKKNGVEFK